MRYDFEEHFENINKICSKGFFQEYHATGKLVNNRRTIVLQTEILSHCEHYVNLLHFGICQLLSGVSFYCMALDLTQLIFSVFHYTNLVPSIRFHSSSKLRELSERTVMTWISYIILHCYCVCHTEVYFSVTKDIKWYGLQW